MWLIMLTGILGNHTSNFSLIGLSISCWQSQLPVGVVMTIKNLKKKTTPTWLITLNWLLGDHMPNSGLLVRGIGHDA